eukprot:scaffold38557_cov36-Phaeocystis_antarctica.AAC.1
MDGEAEQEQHSRPQSAALGRRAAQGGAGRRRAATSNVEAAQGSAAGRRAAASGGEAAHHSQASETMRERIASRDRPHTECSGSTSAGLVLPSSCHCGAAPHSRGSWVTRERARIARACACSHRVRVAQRARAPIPAD